MRVVVENFGVIRELNVELPEVFLLFGPNGVGKTTIYTAITAFGYLEWGRGLYLGRRVSAWRRTPRGRVSVSVEGLPFPRSKCYGVPFPHDVVEELRKVSADHANRLAQCDYGRVTCRCGWRRAPRLGLLGRARPGAGGVSGGVER
ncbi:ATP-binding protein [Thermoproteus tenax]|uniref:ATP-binding protein n=1 Tax=Thermoproteus tenax TaxID=2271 RepID=UPI0018D48EF1|nr:ATP-binding protein [Thermoproteus tenax]